MFSHIRITYDLFSDYDLNDPFSETIRLYDLLSGGCLRNPELSILDKYGIDLGEIIQGRKRGIPLEYIIGEAVFMRLPMYCTPDTLIPRAETELLVNSTLDIIGEREKNNRELTIMELGTGCGNIAVALAMNAPNVKILASDISPGAVAIAQKNADRYDLQDRITLSCGDMFDHFDEEDFRETIDIVVSNPPYIPTSSIEKMDSAITEHEPILALDAGSYGMDIFRKLISGSVPFLKKKGVLIFEIGAGQEKLVDMLFKKSNSFENVRHIDDGNEVRVISAQRK